MIVTSTAYKLHFDKYNLCVKVLKNNTQCLIVHNKTELEK